MARDRYLITFGLRWCEEAYATAIESAIKAHHSRAEGIINQKQGRALLSGSILPVMIPLLSFPFTSKMMPELGECPCCIDSTPPKKTN
jgi:hypothetical protein